MRWAIVRFPGANCDEDARFALEKAGIRAEFVWHTERDLRGFDGVFLPGGFSYGDYLRAGALAAKSPVMEAVRRFAEDRNVRPARHWRMVNEVPTVLMIAIVILVVVKPF